MQKHRVEVAGLLKQKTGQTRKFYGLAGYMIGRYGYDISVRAILGVPTGATVPYIMGACRRLHERTTDFSYMQRTAEGRKVYGAISSIGRAV